MPDQDMPDQNENTTSTAADSGVSDAGSAGAEAQQAATDCLDDPPMESPELVELRETVSRLEGRLRTVSAAYRQQQDEIAAIRARLERQAAVEAERRRGEVVEALFEPAQNLRRSIQAISKAGVAEEYVSGLQMTLHQMMEAFHKLGLEEVPGKGAKFDPNLHEAIATTPVTDPALDGIVLDVFSTGYRIGNRLIAPARVIIGQRQDPVGEA